MYYYKIVDKDTGEHYIGSCVNIAKRLKQHIKGNQVACEKIIKNNNYEFVILEHTDKYDRLEREQYWMDKYPNRINKINAKRKITKKEYNRIYQLRQNRWIRSFGDPRRNNCMWCIDPNIFL